MCGGTVPTKIIAAPRRRSKFVEVPEAAEAAEARECAGIRATIAPVSTFACDHCGAALELEGVRTATCPYCACPNFVERPRAAGQPDPAFALTFTGDAELARRHLRGWLSGRWFADSGLTRATVEDLRGIYLPAYLYSAVARTHGPAEIGENYTEIETYTETDSQGRTVTRTRTVVRTEYRSLAGRHVGYVSDVIVSASAGLANDELQRVEPFDLRQLRRFAPALVTGWIHEEFSRGPDECARLSRDEAVAEIGGRLRRFMPGDSHHSLAWQTAVEWESLDPILVPVWVLAVRYRGDRPPLRVVINGQTGAVTGEVPRSWWKILIAFVVVIAAVAAIALAAGGR